MFLIVGLGNPGKEYENTRHNVGFFTVDKIANNIGVKVSKKGFQGLYNSGEIGGRKVLLLKPHTYMNNSGNAVREAIQFYKIDSGDVIVAHDEMDLPLERIKVKKDGGSAGHNGIKSIIQNLASDNFARVRIGVGKPYDKDKVVKHVLSGFNKEERQKLDKVVENAADCIYEIITSGIDKAMNKFNIRAVKNFENDEV